MADSTRFSRWRRHPWHGLTVGPAPPELVHAFVEITPFDLMKYELDKVSGYLRVDRPQRSSSTPPSLYGFIPRTYCGERVGALNAQARGGDGDPLDICIITERPINRAEVILDARVIGGIQLLDGQESDDKIIAVLASDRFWEAVTDIDELPPLLTERLQHYFSTYKMIPGQASPIEIQGLYSRRQAARIIEAAMADYDAHFGEAHGTLAGPDPHGPRAG